MALLLAMYQKMRLIREKNQATLDLTKFSQKYKRVQDNIERVNKKYTSMLAKIDQQAKMMNSQATSIFQQKLGLGLQNFGGNFINPYTYNGTNGFLLQNTVAFMKEHGIPYQCGTNEDGTAKTDVYKADQAAITAMMAQYTQYGKFIPKTTKAADGTTQVVTQNRVLYNVSGGTKSDINEYDGFKQEDVNVFNYAMQQAQIAQNQAYMMQQQLTQSFSSDVSIWAEAMKAQIEAEQDEMVAPLSYQETMWELEKTNAEAKLKRIEAELQSYEQLANQEAQKSAPTFGLS